jgi:hypothetical protein
MAELVNLRQVRKRRRRAEKERRAQENRAAHGRSAADKRHARLADELASRRLDGARRSGAEPGAEDD